MVSVSLLREMVAIKRAEAEKLAAEAADLAAYVGGMMEHAHKRALEFQAKHEADKAREAKLDKLREAADDPMNGPMDW